MALAAARRGCEDAQVNPTASPPQRKIIHVDMDAFYASVEQRDDPALRGRPVVVAWRGARSVVCAASYEARVFGVRSAMPAVRAERLCPDAVFVPPDFTRYKAVSQQLHDIFVRYTDLVEPLSLDEAYLDVTAPKIELGSATAIAEHIRARIRRETRLTASAGVAPNKFLAKIASDQNKPDGCFVVKPAHVHAFLAQLPLGRLPGVGKVTETHLQRLGLITCQDVRQQSPAWLEQHFGKWGRRLYELSFGIDHRAVVPHRPTLQISTEDTFARDILLPETGEALRALSAKTWQAYLRELQRHPGRHARTVVLKLKTADFKTLTRSHTGLPFPANEVELFERILALCARVGMPVACRFRLAGVGISGFVEDASVNGQTAASLFET